MVIGITKGYVDFLFKGKVVRGWGDMGDKYFYIIASTIEWIFPGKRHQLNDLERDEFIEEVKRCEYELRKEYRMAFEDDNGKMIKKKIKKGKRKSKKETRIKNKKESMRIDHRWDYHKDIILDAKNEVSIFERAKRVDDKRYILMKDAILDNVSLITVNRYLRILGTNDSVYESADKFSNLYKEIFKEEKNIIAHDIFGGLFAEVEASLGKKIHYLAPDSLGWEETEIGYTQFILWAIRGNVSEFYQPFLWDGFYEDVSKLSPEEGIMFHPPVWTENFDKNASCKKTVSLKDILAAKYQDM